MQNDGIREIGIDDEGRLYVRPSSSSFSHIYRTATGVDWDEERRRLHSPKPREWSYIRWFEQITADALGEYGIRLTVTEDTAWSNVPDELRTAISKAAS